jgi:hypothetical protein
VTASLEKDPSYDFYGSGSENAGLAGFDMVARLGPKSGGRARLASRDRKRNSEREKEAIQMNGLFS